MLFYYCLPKVTKNRRRKKKASSWDKAKPTIIFDVPIFISSGVSQDFLFGKPICSINILVKSQDK